MSPCWSHGSHSFGQSFNKSISLFGQSRDFFFDKALYTCYHISVVLFPYIIFMNKLQYVGYSAVGSLALAAQAFAAIEFGDERVAGGISGS